MDISLDDLLVKMLELGASDLHITAGSPPRFRISDKLVTYENYRILTPQDTKNLCYSIMTNEQRDRFQYDGEIDVSFFKEGFYGRIRANIFMQRGSVTAVFRVISGAIKSLQELGLPSSVNELCNLTSGLILITGSPGSGKSTTSASMLETINNQRDCHIVTIENPLEYMLKHKRSIVNQREIASDTGSFKNALKFILRQDPDVVYIGDIADTDSAEPALLIAETEHLCIASITASSVIHALRRFIDFFAPHQKSIVRYQLASCLQGIIAQRLLPVRNNVLRALALEILIPSPAIRNLIREDKFPQIYAMMQATSDPQKMQTMNQSIFNLYINKVITYETAVSYSPNPEEMLRLLSRVS